jgi:hypothetical protein
VLAAIWAALRARRSDRPYPWLAGAGVLCGLSVLAHANMIVLVVPLILLAWQARPASAPEARWRSLLGPGLIVGCMLVTLTPWLVRNAIVMHRFVFVTDETGITLVGTYNHTSAVNHGLPYKWRLYYDIAGEGPLIRQAPQLTELQLSDRLQSQAQHYILGHLTAPFEVAYYNSRRLLELAGSHAWQASAKVISLSPGVARAGVISFYLLCLLALAGAFTRAAWRAWRWLWITPMLLWLSVVLINVETPRFREPIDAFLIVFAACGLAAAVRWLRTRLGGAPVARSAVGPLPTGASERVEVG